jgi:type IV pilus secretin PilQ/predicted competence protein
MRAKLAWALLLAVLLAAGTGAPAWAQDRGPAAITEIRQESTNRSTRLTVDCTGPLAYTYYSPDPLTLVVDIPEMDASRVPTRVNVGTKEVESVRVTSMARADGRSLARLEVRLASLVPYQIFSKDKSLNLVFERAAEVAARPAETPAAKPEDTPAKTAAVPAAAPEPVPAAPAPAPAPAASDKVKWQPVAPADVKAAEAPAPAPAPKTRPAGPRAQRILGVTQGSEMGQLSFTIKADGTLRYQDFFLGNPDRLVVDFVDVVSRAPMRNMEVNEAPVRKVRLAQFSAASPKVARLVLDLSARKPYRIVEGSDGVKIVFGEGETPHPAALAALRTDSDAAAEAAPGPAAEAAPAPQVAPAPPAPAPALLPAPLPDPQEPAPAPIAPEGLQARNLTTGEKVYTGHPISLDFKDGDLQDIFRLFADISGLNIVVNPGVSGKVTLKLNEVPWDQALDLILKANGLGYTLEGNVIRIAKLSDLQKEEQDRRKLEEEKALAGNLEVWNKTLSYAKATEMQDTVKKVALSARGTITLDPRTNTMIITDLPANLAKARDLIADLDRATPQVEIEARIVVTSRNFTRDLGIQWGFTHQQTPLFANTTNLTFPNSIIINGSGVPSSGGIAPDNGGLSSTAGIAPAGRGYAVNLPASGFNTGIGITLGNILGNFNLDLALTALERQGRGRLLSTPKVTTQNNHAAEIKQGVQIPIQTVANNTVTVSFKDAVLTLKVTPQITEANTVILDLSVENNAADFANLVNGIPPINTQSAQTQVLVKDGATAVIGGIFQSNEQTSQNSTPFLSKVPILGYLFRNRFVTNTNNELLLFITPRIIKS